MASESIASPQSLPASGVLITSQFCFVDLNSDGEITLPSTGGDAVGILQDKPTYQGQPSAVACHPGDFSKIVSADTIPAGGHIMTDSSGHAVNAVTSGHVLGRALEDMVSGGIYQMLFMPGRTLV